jgi:transposase
MRAAFRRRWRAFAAGRPAASAAAPPFRTVIGRPSPLSVALRWRGFVAPMLLDGPMDGVSFLAWLEQMLAPTLHPGDIVVMDNLAAHKVVGVRQSIEACGAELHYLPPCSPDLNPIENAFAKLKAHVRKSAARSLAAKKRIAERDAEVPQLCPSQKCPSEHRPRRSILSCCMKGLSGGRTRARTWDPMIKSHLLYQLSYAPGTGPESLRKRASFSKASSRCPAIRRDFPSHRDG